MNFELIDNLFQVTVFFTASAIGSVLAFHRQDRRLLILSLAYASFAIGTSYWLLHIAIRGEPPQVFCVPELSWGACYLFYLSIQILRCEKLHIRFSPYALLFALAMLLHILRYHIMGPSYFTNYAFSLIIGVMTYLTVYRLLHCTPARSFDLCLLIVMLLQLFLYMISVRMEDFIHFNTYFAVDILLTLCSTLLMPLLAREVDG